MKFLLILLSLFGCTSTNKLEVEPESHSAVIRLHDMQGNFFCSASVVSAKYAITANHCISGEPIVVYDSYLKPTGVMAVPVRGSRQMDYAVIEGDFSKFKFLRVETNIKLIINNFLTGSLVACGYPMAGPLVCLPVSNAKQLLFYFRADGNLYPGMSGGPVIDKTSGKIIGINSAVYENGVVLAPVINLLFNLDLK